MSSLLSVLILAASGYLAVVYSTVSGIRRSHAVGSSAAAAPGHDINLLVMGLDSRLDENGNPLPKDIYNALHAGDNSDGGLNSNVLIFIHIPADGSKATGFSIPRDDYVDLHGCPLNECKGKIKEAYGLAVAQKQDQLAAKGVTGQAAYQQAREAGRAEEIQTVQDFLGVSIDQFVEVTMVAFFEIAQVIQPITVCVKENTVDTYSGADFKAGVQQINAQQAVAFVRQRRDTSNPGLQFTDLDRERRQQAFIISVLTQLKSAKTLLDPSKLMGILNVAKQNIVLSAGLDPLHLAQLASTMSGGNLRFYTLPILGFGTDPAGQSVNLVDPATIRSTVASLLQGGTPPAPSAATSSTPPSSEAASGGTDVPSSAPPTAAPGTGGGSIGPAPTQLTVLSASGIPCVK